MSRRMQVTLLIALPVLALLLVFGCAKEKKQADLEITDYELSVHKEREGSNAYVIDAKGTVANVGEVDVKNVEVTGYCRTCGEQIINGEWFVSEYDKMAHQKDVISYLAAGAEEDFEFDEIAFYAAPEGYSKPEGVPEDHEFEIVIESYEVVE